MDWSRHLCIYTAMSLLLCGANVMTSAAATTSGGKSQGAAGGASKKAQTGAVVPSHDSPTAAVAASASVAQLQTAVKAAELKGDKNALAQSLAALALACVREGDDDAAKDAFSKAIAANASAFGKQSTQVALVLSNAALLSARVGMVADADDRIENALSIWRAQGESQWLNLASCLLTKADIQDIEGNSGLAEDTLKESLAILEKHSALAKAKLAEALKQYARLLRKLERADEALSLERRADQLVSVSTPEPSKGTAGAGKAKKDLSGYKKSMDLASEASKKSDWVAALDSYKQALGEAKKLGELDPYVPEAMMYVGLGYQLNKDLGQAESTYKDAIELRKRIVGPDSPAVAFDMERLARLYEAQMKWSDAANWAGRALVIFKKSDLDPAIYWDVLNDLVTIDIQLKRPGEAKDYANQMVSLAEKKYGTDSFRYGNALMLLASICFSEQNFKQGQEMAAKAASIMKSKSGAGAVASEYTRDFEQAEKVRHKYALLEE